MKNKSTHNFIEIRTKTSHLSLKTAKKKLA